MKRRTILFAIGGCLAAVALQGMVHATPENSDAGYYLDRSTGNVIRIGAQDVEIVLKNTNLFEAKYTYTQRDEWIAAVHEYESDWKDFYIYTPNHVGGFDLHLTAQTPRSPELSSYLISDTPTVESLEEAILLATERNPDHPEVVEMLVPIPDHLGIAVLSALRNDDLGLARRICDQLRADHPTDLFTNIIHLDLLAWERRDDELAAALECFREVLPPNGDDLRDYTIRFHEVSLRGFELARRGVGMSERIAALGEAPTREEWHHALFDYDAPPLLLPVSAVLFDSPKAGALTRYFHMHTVQKVARVEIDFLLLQGHIEEARELALKLQRLSIALMASDRFGITRMLGGSNMKQDSRHSSLIHLSGYTEADALAEAFADLATIYRDSFDAWSAPALWDHAAAPEYMSEQEVWLGSTEGMAQVALLHTAVSIRHHLLATGDWPADGSIGTLLEAPTPDPFSQMVPRAPLKVVRHDDMMIIYSVGPDGVDDKALVECEANYGTRVSGDIVLRITRDRQYPFPTTSDPPPATRAELFQRYPNGLPPDLFADTWRRSYITSDTTPPIVWSHGPDVDQKQCGRDLPANHPQLNAGAAHSPKGMMHFQNVPDQPQYDPTNGTVSAGNLYLRFAGR